MKINASAGSLEVLQDHDDAAALLADIGDVLRGLVDAGNGEILMVGLDAHIVSQCGWPGHLDEK